MAFDWAGKEAPNAGNNWHLTDNPCWPSDIVPGDPGYVLLADDPWYSNTGSGFWKTSDIKLQNGTLIYNLDPSDDLQKAADLKRPDLAVAGRIHASGLPISALVDTAQGIKKPIRRVRRAAFVGEDHPAIAARYHQCKLSLDDREPDPWCDGELLAIPSKPAPNLAVPTLIHTTIGRAAQKGETDLSPVFPAATSG
ncbi:hypothetical protein MRB53_037460 [Persea americana]|nr:hypothetical protein MRB53_037460 [Persea americana]